MVQPGPALGRARDDVALVDGPDVDVRVLFRREIGEAAEAAVDELVRVVRDAHALSKERVAAAAPGGHFTGVPARDAPGGGPPRSSAGVGTARSSSAPSRTRRGRSGPLFCPPARARRSGSGSRGPWGPCSCTLTSRTPRRRTTARGTTACSRSTRPRRRMGSGSTAGCGGRPWRPSAGRLAGRGVAHGVAVPVPGRALPLLLEPLGPVVPFLVEAGPVLARCVVARDVVAHALRLLLLLLLLLLLQEKKCVGVYVRDGALGGLMASMRSIRLFAASVVRCAVRGGTRPTTGRRRRPCPSPAPRVART